MKNLDTALLEYIESPQDPENNFELGYAYDQIGQTASALSFYIRSAEKSSDVLLQYESLIRAALCFEKQGNRKGTTSNLYQQAISIMPDRPEAYFLLSRLYESAKDWQGCYLHACIGLNAVDVGPPFKKPIDYPGRCGLEFQKTLGSWWVGFYDQAKQRLFEMKYDQSLPLEYKISVEKNLETLGYPSPATYTKKMRKLVKIDFPGLDDIERNYAQCFQDLFVLAALNGKKKGTYLEVGSGDPYHTSNTALLEKQFGWKGLGIDIDKQVCEKYYEERVNPVFCINVVNLDYSILLNGLNMPKEIDYLQIDCNPVSLSALKTIPFKDYKFAVVTYEHDGYSNPGDVMDSRKILDSQGYVLLVNDICYNHKDTFEDWWIHPDLIDDAVADKIRYITDAPKFAGDWLFHTK